MREKSELKKCPSCNRKNWHELKNCSWCCKPLPTAANTIADWIMGTVSVASLIALGWWVTRL